jgi:hypothetical protein
MKFGLSKAVQRHRIGAVNAHVALFLVEKFSDSARHSVVHRAGGYTWRATDYPPAYPPFLRMKTGGGSNSKERFSFVETCHGKSRLVAAIVDC